MLGFVTTVPTSLHGLKRKFINDESGATATEYGLIAVAIAGAIVAVMFAIGDEINYLFLAVQTRLGNA